MIFDIMIHLEKDKSIQNIIIISSFFLITFLSIFFLFKTHTLFGTEDMQFHLKRIKELICSIKHGVLFPHFSFNEFHGSAVMTLYPYINLYPAVFFSLFIHSFVSLIYVFIGFNIFVSLISCYYGSYSFSKLSSVSYIFAVIYSLSSPFMTYCFGDMDMGVISVISYLPLVIFGFLNLITYKRYSWLLLPMGIILIIYSHVLSIFIVIGLLLVWLLINIKLINKFLLKKLLYIILLVSLFTSIIWGPALTLIIHNIHNIRPVNTPSLKGYSILFVLKAALFNYLNFCLGLFMILGLLLSLICYKTFNSYLKQMLWISIFILFICSNLFPWKMLMNNKLFKLLSIFQFTYRFYIIPQIFLSYLFAICIYKIFYRNKYIFVIPIIILFAICLQIFMQRSIIYNGRYDKSFSNRYIYYNRTIIGENHKYLTKQGLVKPTYIYDHVINYTINNFYGYHAPGYKLINNNQVNKFCNSNMKLLANSDYYPMNSIIKLNYINNREAFVNRKKMLVRTCGYNKFVFYKHISNVKIALPILIYRNEKIRIFLNGKHIRYYVNKYGQMVIFLISNRHVNYIKIQE